MNFTPLEFNKFKESIFELDFDIHATAFPDQSERVIVPTANVDVKLSFLSQEWSDLKDALAEASLMQEVYEMMDSK